jgi:hypothetical protein
MLASAGAAVILGLLVCRVLQVGPAKHRVIF